MRAALLLAAGSARRFGRGNKLLAPMAGRPILFHALDRALAAGVGRVIVVTGTDRARVERLVRSRADRRFIIVHSRRSGEGMGASLAAGLAKARPIERELLVFLGDMPFAACLRGLRLRPGIDAVRPISAGRPGHPLLVRTHVARDAGPSGDRGLIARIDPARIWAVAGLPGNLLDIDTVGALRRARRRIAGAPAAFGR